MSFTAVKFPYQVSGATLTPGESADLQSRYYRRFFSPATTIAAGQAISDLVSMIVSTPPTQSRPLWTGDVLRRLRDSTAPRGMNAPLDGKWIAESVARSAAAFFSSYASFLPSEPYIYASNDGDLVAEFQGPMGRLTAIIGDMETTLFASVNGRPNHWSSDSRKPEAEVVRKFSKMLTTSNGPLDAKS